MASNIGIAVVAVSVCIYVVHGGSFKHFSTKTPYEWIRLQQEESKEDDLYNLDRDGFMCSAVHTTAVIRHGARFPGLSDVTKIKDIHARLQIVLSRDKFEDLVEWENRFPENDDKFLSHVGEKEQHRLGSRVASRLKSLFVDEDIDMFRFVISSKERTKSSAQSFFDGFVEAVASGIDEPFSPELNDRVLRFHEQCRNYVESVDKNKSALVEYNKFKDGEEMNAVLKKVNAKLGIRDGVLNTGDLRPMYIVCGYEMALFKGSPWCSLFDEDDMRTLEYLSDLKHYYKNGYGHDINHQQACPLLSDIFDTMDDAVHALEVTSEEEEEDTYMLGNFLFGHAETLGPIMTALGLFNDSDKLRADNFAKQADRKFRTSKIMPFSSNVMFVLYECEPSDGALLGENQEEEEDIIEYHVKVLVNERPVVLPGCQKEVCPYKEVRERYLATIEACDFKRICGSWQAPKDEL